MSGNTFGRLFCVTSFGESHGPAIGGVVDGCPPRMSLSVDDIQQALERRRPGRNAYVTQRAEPDQLEILSGVYQGQTTGAPIAMLIRNVDQRTQDYDMLANVFRPGHADYTYWHKYGIRDPRGGGRASARETAVRVAAGAIAQKWLRQQGIVVRGHIVQIGDYIVPFSDWSHVEHNPFFAADAAMVPTLAAYIDTLRAAQDSVGARLRVVAEGVPVGLGAPVYDKLDAAIAYAMMGINAVKGVEIGAGFAAVTQRGSQHADELSTQGFSSNHAGGILGGISTGQTIEVSLAVKPTSSIGIERRTLDHAAKAVTVQVQGRHDPCVGLRAVPVAEAMLALVLIDHVLQHRAIVHSALFP